MAELVGLSVAANIAQFVVLGLKSVDYAYNAYNQTAEFQRERGQIKAATLQLQQTAERLEGDVRPADIDASLSELIARCRKVSADLLHKMGNVTGREGQRTTSADKIRNAYRVWSSRSDIKKMQEELVKLRDQVSHQLVVLSYRSMSPLIGDVESLGFKVQANHDKAVTQLRELHRRLDAQYQRMEDASAEVKSGILAKMTSDTKVTAKNCLMRHQTESVLKSLTFEKIVERRSVIPTAHENTFRWALSKDATTLFKWLESDHGTYWIQGKAGCGKSTLMKFLESESQTALALRKWAGDRPLLVASHYFWGPGTNIQRSLNGLFRTLLFQILIQDPHLLEEICPSRLQSFRHLSPWTSEELQNSFNKLSMVQPLPSKLCFFIDGLDEFHGDPEELLMILEATSKSPDIKLCVASRPWLQYQEAYGHSQWQLAVHDLTRGDIESYIHDKMNANWRWIKMQKDSPDRTASLLRDIADSANGVFLWVYLATRDLLRGLKDYDDDISTLAARLSDIPKDLEPYFGRMLNSIDCQYYYETTAIFSMVAFSHASVSTLHTWAFREYRQTISLFGHGLLEEYFSAGDVSKLAKVWLLQRQRTNNDRDLYNAAREKRRVTARCRDLVHISEIKDSHSFHFQIGFLHRTVADFLLLPSTSRTLEDRLTDTFEAPPLLGLMALAQGYVELLLRDLSSEARNGLLLVDRHEALLWALYLVREVRFFSPPLARFIMYQLWSLTELDRLQHERSYGKPKSDLLIPQNPSLKVMVSDKELGNAGGAEKFHRLYLLIDTQSFGSFDEECSEKHQLHQRLSVTSSQRLYWNSTCGKCLQEMFKLGTQRSQVSSATTLLFMHFQGKWNTPLRNDTGASADEIIAASIKNDLWSQQSKKVDLDIIRTLINVLEEGPDGAELIENLWKNILRTIRSIEEQSFPMPTNIYEVCQVMIRHGAPRYTQFAHFDFESASSFSIMRLARQRTRTYDDDITKLLIDSSLLLNQIPEISHRSPRGMQEEWSEGRFVAPVAGSSYGHLLQSKIAARRRILEDETPAISTPGSTRKNVDGRAAAQGWDGLSSRVKARRLRTLTTGAR